MPVVTDFDADLKIGGVTVPITLAVVEKLSYDLILGMDFFRQTDAVVDVSAQTIDLLGGLTSVPMTATGEHEIALAAIAAVIPPCSEVVLPARAKNNLVAGDYMLEDEMNAPCRRLMIARALVDPSKGTFACRLLNPTDTPISCGRARRWVRWYPSRPRLRRRRAGGRNEPTGRVAAVGAAPSIETMRKDLEAKGISLADTALRGEELDQLIRLLYENMDIMATSIAELPGTDIMRHRIETGDSPPIRKRAYRHSPQDMAEISRQTKEC
jgi:hypothetical protein